LGRASFGGPSWPDVQVWQWSARACRHLAIRNDMPCKSRSLGESVFYYNKIHHQALSCRSNTQLRSKCIRLRAYPQALFGQAASAAQRPTRNSHATPSAARRQRPFPEHGQRPSPSGGPSLGVRRSFSLKAANRLVRGSPDPRAGTSFDGAEPSARSLGRLGMRSPVDWRMAWRVCQPSVERSWNESARSCWLATRHKSANSSCENRVSRLAFTWQRGRRDGHGPWTVLPFDAGSTAGGNSRPPGSHRWASCQDSS